MTQDYSEPVATEHTLQVLEFDAVRRLLSHCMSSDLGRSLLPSVVPLADLPCIRRKQCETSEAKALLLDEALPSLQQLVDPRPLLEQVAQHGKVLDPQELLELQFLFLTARQAKHFLGRVADRYPLLAALMQPMDVPDHIERFIGQVVDARGEIKDEASPRLQDIRHELRGTRERTKRRLDWHLTQHKEVVQEPLITLRHNRYVIPLRPDYRRLLHGIVHDHSASGATVFVEPLDVLELNNRVVELTTAEDVEVHRILRQITGAVWETRGHLHQIAGILAELDYILARGHLSLRLQGHEPVFTEEGRLELIQARHPLLVAAHQERPDVVMPATLAIGPETRTLVITGPNTGGKTVLLKTIGLLTLMAQAGLHIPADEGSQLTCFHRVLADIGDEQNIAQSLSTFSGHMHHIVTFLREVDARSLVLLDELGAGTDPAEGAALGIAILEHFQRRGAKTFVTTHQHAVKLHAHLHPEMETAVMEFDAETLEPTFHVRLGHFGGSNAFAISQRLGMPPEVLSMAQAHLHIDEHRLVEVADRLREELRAVEHSRREVERDRQAAAEARMHYEGKLAGVEKERRLRLAQAADEASRLLAEARRRLDEAIHDVRQQGVTPAVESAREVVRQVEAELEELATRTPLQEAESKPLCVGELVWLPKWRVRGVVVKEFATSGVVEVQAGQMTFKVPAAEVEPLGEIEQPRPTRSPALLHRRALATPDISSELNLIGWRVTDALPYLDKYLDGAVAAGMPRVRIIHGKGSGRLRAAVHELLTSHPQVKAFMPCSPAEGGWGATLVEINA
jgi:DNA mismatch repair protein MutS2